MNPTSPTDSGPEGTCRQVRDALVRLERAGPDEGSPRPVLDRLTAHLAGCASCRTRYAGRLDRQRALAALRERSAPEGTFDDFFDQLRARVPYAPTGGGMSAAFLDAPRSLRLWRGAAVAASVLLVATAGLALTRGGGGASPAVAERPLHDPRDALLEAYESPVDARRLRDGGRRGHAGFYDTTPSDVTPVKHGWR